MRRVRRALATMLVLGVLLGGCLIIVAPAVVPIAWQWAVTPAGAQTVGGQTTGNVNSVNNTNGAKFPAPGDITDVGTGIVGRRLEVHVDIADDVERLLRDSQADGVNLDGGGYRDNEGQIRVRKANCGLSHYAIYQKKSSLCSPPTARPGRSMHEQGKAIDFRYNGGLIRSRSGPGWAWLKANAYKYGLYNLPSEPWHWSVNGR